ncbi:putative toxin-antitoxin system toxin component, PIN family [Flavihumibacter stibioxidans]|uniref:Toxin-antitoxin system toxin component, PIN family n=1 Tax=Flavihumibacter stibioxidans TaxID=1834163 RepID=A0ABR7M6W3_9BACT|nr:putative toxin-antitoxin system toxin component, PIN family [Flavihumibacter stibioxidans]MBC6490697.1 putative toxin-antitoxin system toxin component, PIN family [Flavihumibacter stibioxidans]
MPKKVELIIVDTNLWLSFLIKRTFSKLDKILISGQVKLVFSEELLGEFVEVARRPKFRKYISSEDIHDLLLAIQDYAIFFEVLIVDEICRDPKDDFLLALATSSKADYLLTGDQDLLVLKRIGKTKIITLSEYLSGK